MFLRRFTNDACKSGLATYVTHRCSSSQQIASDESRPQATTTSHNVTQEMQRAVWSIVASPTSPVPINELWHQFATRERMVTEFDSFRRVTRLARCSTALQFLKNHNVLLHSLLYFVSYTGAARWNKTKDFDRLATVGLSILRNETLLRMTKLFSKASLRLKMELLERVTSTASLAALFNELECSRLLDAKGRRAVKLTDVQKSKMICALLGEMHWFATRTRATDRTHNNALFPPSDVLILHVLCFHSVECILTESIVGQLQPTFAEIKQKWRNFHESTPRQLRFRPRTTGALSLSNTPRERIPPMESEPAATVGAALTVGGLHGLREVAPQDVLLSKVDSTVFQFGKVEKTKSAPRRIVPQVDGLLKKEPVPKGAVVVMSLERSQELVGARCSSSS